MRSLRISAIVLLAFLGLSALAGSIPMIRDPSGDSMGIPLSLLRYSPFESYLIPGIILLAADGLLALGVLWVVLRRIGRYGLWTAFQGCVLLGWLVVECWLLRTVMWLHYFYAAIALGLIICGLMLWRNENPAQAFHNG